MSKPPLPFVNQRKQKSRIALCIRVSALIAVAGFYVISTILIDREDTKTAPGEHYLIRKPLGLGVNLNNNNNNNNNDTREPVLGHANGIDDVTEISNTSTSHSIEGLLRSNLSAVDGENVDPNEVPVPRNCVQAAILELPSDGLTRTDRQHGWIMIHILLACYCFWMLATICDEYFVPAIEAMCSTFNMNEDVVGATFMAAATSSPELFINSVGTFITKSDIGVGTVVGSAVFNVLAVPACCGLFAGQVVQLDWWPVSRDCFMYAISVVSLIAVLYDGQVMWYEGLALALAYFIYISVMYWNDTMARKARMMVSKMRRLRKTHVRPYRERTEITPLLSTFKENGSSAQNGSIKMNGLNGHATNGSNGVSNGKNGVNGTTVNITSHLYPIEEDDIDYADSPWSVAPDKSCCTHLLRWPITLALWLTIPDCRRHPRCKMLTFTTCIIWIGLISYVVAMLITIVGDTADIPDSIMGLTFLAAGTSVPEAVSSVIVTKQGHGAMGISNSIGSNTFDILLCLGLPWFIKAYYLPDIEGDYSITFNSSGLTYSAVSLLSTLFGLYLSFALNKFKLDYKIGLACTAMYGAYLTFASLIEMNYFFTVNLPTCPH